MDQPNVNITQRQGYQFDNGFAPGIATLRTDEPAPLGTGTGPSPVDLLAAAVGNCLTASLLFACQKYKDDPSPLRAEVKATVGRNDRNRMRVLGLVADLHLGKPAAEVPHLGRVLETFEDFCTVTQSINAAVPVTLRVIDSTGAVLKG